MSYLVDDAGGRMLFAATRCAGPGQVWDLHSLQKGFGTIGDYHGFMGNHTKLAATLRKIAESSIACAVPSHGARVARGESLAQLTARRLEEVWRNYTGISALNHYFPNAR